MDDVQIQIKNSTRIILKRIEADMFGFKHGDLLRHRRYLKKNWFGAVVEHKLSRLNLSQVDNDIIGVRISRHGFYKLFSPKESWQERSGREKIRHPNL